VQCLPKQKSAEQWRSAIKGISVR